MPALINTESIVAAKSHRLMPRRFDRLELFARYDLPGFAGLAEDGTSPIDIVRFCFTASSAGCVSNVRATASDISSASISADPARAVPDERSYSFREILKLDSIAA